MKASDVTVSKKSAKEKPDLEEAIEESEDADLLEDKSNEDTEDLDLSKDKYVKRPKKTTLQRKPVKVQRGKKQEENSENGLQDSKATKESKKGKGKGKVSSKRN